MIPAPRRLAAVFLALVGPLGGTAAADEPGPPPGWEAPPPLAAPSPRPRALPAKPVLPACCAHDSVCCQRQLDLDAARPSRVARVVEARVAELPELVMKEAPAGGPALTGAPGVRVIDGEGRPAPWPDPPRLEVRVVPVGCYGELHWGDGWQDWTPFFRAPEHRSMGYGLVRGVWRDTGDARTILAGKIAYTTFDQGAGEGISVDYVRGVLTDKPEVVVARWGHVEAAPVVGGFVHAYRGRPPHDPAPDEAPLAPPADGEAITFVLPEVFLGFESKDAKHEGGHLVSRFSRIEAYTTFTLPVGPGRSGLATFFVAEQQLARWFRRPATAGKQPTSTTLALSSSQTSAEAAPRVRVVMFGE